MKKNSFGARIDLYITVIINTLLIISSVLSVGSFFGLISAVLSLKLIRKPEFLFSILFVSSLLSESCFIYGSITAARFFTLYVIFACIFNSVENWIVSKRVFCFTAFLFVYVGLFAFASKSGLTGGTITLMLNIVVVFAASLVRVREIRDTILLFTIGCIEILVCIVLNYFNGSALHDNGSYELLVGTNNNDIAMALAQMGGLFLAIFIIYDYEKKLPVKKFSFVFLTFICMVMIFFLGSRSAAFGLAGGVGVGLIYNQLLADRKMKRIIMYGGVFIIVFVGLNYVLQTNDVLAQRFTISEVVQSKGTSRFGIWECVWNEAFLKHPLFGVGFGGENIQNILLNNGIHHSGTHNIVLDMLAQLGIVGTTVLLLGFGSLIININRQIKQKIILIIPIVCLAAGCFNGIGENIYSARFMWIDVALALLMLNSDYSCSSEKNNSVRLQRME